MSYGNVYTTRIQMRYQTIWPQFFTERLKVNKNDRTYQIWKREPLSIELFTEKALLQKLEYVHENPVAAVLVNFAAEYK